MELRHLRYFVAVAEARGITKAAARLNVSQPPLSRQIRDLEEELQVSLLTRGPREIALTQAGRLFLKQARAILAKVDEAVRQVRSLPQQASGVVRVGYSPSPTTELMPRVLKRFRKSMPNVRVSLQDLASDEILTGLQTQALDIALMVEPPINKGSGLRFEPLQPMRIGVLVSNEHPFTRQRSVTLAEALSEPLVTFVREGYPDYHLWLSRTIRLARRRPRVVASVDGASSLLTAVESGLGVAFGPPAYAVIAGKRARFIPILPEAPPIQLGVVVRRGQTSPIVEAFLDAVRTAAGGP